MSREFIFQMQDLRKVVPPRREILKGIWLSFFFGAKIGVLGLNGAGKSSLLRVMAGLDKDFSGEAFPAKGIRTGFLPQEPQLDQAKTVLGNIEEGVAEIRALLDRYGAISERLAACAGPTKMPIPMPAIQSHVSVVARMATNEAAISPTSARMTTRLEPSQSSSQAKSAAPQPAATLSTIPNMTTSGRLRPKAPAA